MPAKADLLADIRTYMKSYITICMGADNHLTKSRGSSVQTLIQNAGVNFGARHTEVSLTAPLVYAYFSVLNGARNTNIFGFSRPTIRVDLDVDDGTGNGLPVYLIPYREGNARGVKLPSQATDGLGDVFAITCAQDGCTFEVYGSRASPYVSHSNCIDQARGLRQHKMQARLTKLHARYLAAEQALLGGPYVPPPDTVAKRGQFQHYTDPGTLGAIGTVNYTDGAQRAVQKIGTATTFKGARESTGTFRHRRYLIQLTTASYNDIMGPQVGAGQVIGKRSHGVWTFYYQEHAALSFNVTAVEKVGAKIETGRHQVGTTGVKFADVILCSGRLWPHRTREYLDPDDYN
jgi:hypothetical protein